MVSAERSVVSQEVEVGRTLEWLHVLAVLAGLGVRVLVLVDIVCDPWSVSCPPSSSRFRTIRGSEGIVQRAIEELKGRVTAIGRVKLRLASPKAERRRKRADICVICVELGLCCYSVLRD